MITCLTPPSVVERNIVLLSEVGSRAYGTNMGDTDTDLMGIFIPPPEYVMGMKTKDHWVSSTGSDDSANGPDDVDATVYSLEKFVRLAVAGNPTVLNLFFVPARKYNTRLGIDIKNSHKAFISKQVAPRYLGYMKSQMERLQGKRGQKRVKRPELVEKYGYDTKYAYQIALLAIQGRELLRTGSIEMPASEANRELLLNIRNGHYNLPAVMQLLETLESRFKYAADTSKLSDEPDLDKINRLLIHWYREHWHWDYDRDSA